MPDRRQSLSKTQHCLRISCGFGDYIGLFQVRETASGICGKAVPSIAEDPGFAQRFEMLMFHLKRGN